MGNNNSSMQDISQKNYTSPSTPGRKNSSSSANNNKNVQINYSDSAPSISQPIHSKPYNINRVKQNNYGESPFVGSPLTQPDELPNRLSKNSSGSSDNDKIYRQEIGLRDDGKDLPQPDSFPNSLPEKLNRRASLNIQEKTQREISSLQSNKGIATLISWNSPAKNVYVTGTFNGWKHKIPLNKCTNEFSTVINFPIGIHHIKFIVDDEWKCSNELLTCTDQDGNLVNYIEVDENIIKLDNPINNNDLLSSSPPGEYTSQIPNFNLNKPKEEMPTRPPSLPPHLEKVILNASLPDSHTVSNQDESWVLPVPNHVVLNHLYACSIRDGVMAVAGTTRYQKKYVTTIYYKPVII